MVIQVEKSSYIAPHRQLGKTKTYILLEGGMYVVFFDNLGNIENKLILRPWDKKGSTLLRFDSSPWHTVHSITKTSTYVETAEGPYKPESTQFAEWAPANKDSQGIFWLKSKIKVL